MTRFRLLLATLSIGFTCAHASADDWTRFRGPNGSGIAEGKFSSDVSEKDFAWKVVLPGKGHASPVIWKDRVYTTAGDSDEGKRYVICLNAKDGSMAWKKEYDFSKFKQHADNSFASATPAVDELAVYVAWCTPEKYTLFALSHEGKELWQQDLGSFKSQQGQGNSPIVVDEQIILGNDQEGAKSSLCGYDRRTGALQWKIERKSTDKTAMSTPVVYRPKDGPVQVIFTGKNGFTSVDPKAGQVVWDANKVFDARTVGSPVVTGDLIIGACGEGGEHRLLVAVRPGQAGEEPTPVYTVKHIAPYVPTPLAKGDRLFMWGDAGQVTCANLTTGAEVWSERVGGMYYGSPVCVGDTLWCMSRKGELVGVSATDKFKLVTKINLGEPSHATPAVAGGKMYLRTVSQMICVNLKPVP
jgi:outer membrane protein assembly factor BamB